MLQASLGWAGSVSSAATAALAVVGALAGFVDSIAGGGGLLTLPALLVAGLPPHLALGTNKGQSVFGSGSALVRFARSPLLDRRRARQGFPFALLGAAAGVALVSVVPQRLLTPLVMVLLLAVAVVVALRRTSAPSGPRRSRPAWLAAGIAAALAAYDGFFGPGTGTFLIMAYVALWNDPLDEASANAKVVNFASNLGSLAVFAAQGLVVWAVALPMGLGQALGAWTGAHLTVRRGRGLVRGFVILVSLALVLRLAWQLLTGR